MLSVAVCARSQFYGELVVVSVELSKKKRVSSYKHCMSRSPAPVSGIIVRIRKTLWTHRRFSARYARDFLNRCEQRIFAGYVVLYINSSL